MRSKKIICSIAFLLVACSRSAYPLYPEGYEQLYLMLTWPNDARSLALGHGIITTPDGYHHDALVNPSFASLPKGIYVSLNTHVELIHYHDLYFANSHFVEGWPAGSDLDDAALQKISLGITPLRWIGVQFNYVRNHASASIPVVGDTLEDEGIQTAYTGLYAITVAAGAARKYSVGVTAKYYAQENRWDHNAYHRDQVHSGWSYSVGASFSDLLPQLTWHPVLSHSRHSYARFRGERSEGISLAFVVRDFGPATDIRDPRAWFFPFKADPPTTIGASLSYLALKSDELSLEVSCGFAQNYRGTYKENFWDLQFADYALASEVTLFNLARLRWSAFRYDLNKSNAWGISIGPPSFQIEYAEMVELGLLSDWHRSYNDGRRILSITVNHAL